MINNSQSVEEFNDKQKTTLKELCGDLGKSIKDVKYYVGYWDGQSEFTVSNLEAFDEGKKEPHSFLNYYWAEYEKNGTQYRITMYYKDFDHGSGNIHVLPGAIQVWKKINCKSNVYKGFCKKDLRNVKKSRDGKIYYSMAGGKPYCEFGWLPLLDDVFFWNDVCLTQAIACIKDENYKCLGKGINSNEFYKSVVGYAGKHRGGHYMRYSIFRFTKDELFYKTMCVKDLGFFTKFDGEAVGFVKGEDPNDSTNINENGPNYYDPQNGEWIIQEKQYGDNEKEKTNEK